MLFQKHENIKTILTISREKLNEIYKNRTWDDVLKALEGCGIKLQGKEEKRWRKGWEEWKHRHPQHKGAYTPPPDPPPAVIAYREETKEYTNNQLVSVYFQYLEKINNPKTNDDERMKYSMASLPLLEPLIRNALEEYGWFDIQRIPALEFAIDRLAPSGLKGGLLDIKALVEYFPQLAPWKQRLKKALK